MQVGQVIKNNSYFNASVKPGVTFKAEQNPINVEQKSDTFEKHGMSAGVKTAIGAGSLLALLTIGLGIRKHLNAKNIKKITQKAIDQLQKVTSKKSVNAGKNVQETITNVLGKNSGITPHSYDVSKEFPGIAVYRSQGGYKDGFVTPNGIVEATEPVTELLLKSVSHAPNKSGEIPGFKNKVVKLFVKDPSHIGAPDYPIIFVSPNQNYTPLQKDVLKLMEHPEKIDSKVFDKICAFKNMCDVNGQFLPNFVELAGKYENLDYDLILSAIQSMVRNI